MWAPLPHGIGSEAVEEEQVGSGGFLDLGIQQWIVVPSPRSVMVDFRPEFEKDVLRHQFLDAVKLKHFVMDTTQFS
ncbi:hypothetical protein Tco_0878497, partial [Tanacetum coccineum]